MKLQYISSHDHIAYILTKTLSIAKLVYFKDNLDLLRIPLWVRSVDEIVPWTNILPMSSILTRFMENGMAKDCDSSCVKYVDPN